MGDALLTNRELASLVALCGFAILAIAIVRRTGKSAKIGRALLSALKVPMSLKILVLWGLYVCCVCAVLVPANRIGLWNADLWKETVLWWIVSGVGLFGRGLNAATETGVFAVALKRLVISTVYFEFVANLASFPLWLEIPAQFLAVIFVMITVVADRDPEPDCAVSVAHFYLGAFGLAAIGWGISNLVSGWSAIDKSLLWREFVLPLWLTPVALAFLYPLAVFTAYESVFVAMRFGARGERLIGPRLAVTLWSTCRLSRLRILRGPAAWHIGRTGTFRAAWREVGEAQREHRERVESKVAAKRRLEDNAGLVGVDSEGKQLDQREHAATMEALRWLATCQMGHYRNRGQRYNPDFDDIIDSLPDRYGLPRPIGVLLRVSDDGQCWYAHRESVTGHSFAIGAAGPPSDQWLYDGPTPPAGFPNESEWDQWVPGDNSPNWN